MKLFRCIIAITLILSCCLSISGCSKENDLVGVYQREGGDPNQAHNRIILYKDGSCYYHGNDGATWSYKDDVVTITTYGSDKYYLDICFDKSIAVHEFASSGYCDVMIACWGFDSVSSSKLETLEEDRIIRLNMDKLLKEEENQELFNTLKSIKGVQKVECITEDGNSWDYELQVVDGCLVADSYPLDTVYVKIGEK